MRSWLDLPNILLALSEKRPLFHSEADFQHALAWEIQTSHPSCSVRLEVPFAPFMASGHIDLVAAQACVSMAVELKYKTRGIDATQGTEAFHLKNQSAQDIGRYDFLKDIWRIERVVASNPDTLGIAVFLTNDSAYWTRAGKASSVDAAFRLHEGRALSGSLSWAPNTGSGTMKTRESALVLSGCYPANWTDYSTLPSGGYCRFRYLLVEVTGRDQAA